MQVAPMELPGGYLLAVRTDRSLIAPHWTLAQAVAQSVGAGANLVIMAEEDLPRSARFVLARFVRDAVHGRCPWIVVGDARLAEEVGADGCCLDASGDALAVGGSHGLRAVRITRAEEAALAKHADFAILELDWSSLNSALDAVGRMRRSLPGLPLLAGTDPPLEAVQDLCNVGAQGVVLCAQAMDVQRRGEVVEAFAHNLRACVPKR
ncbi:MAG: hypothetical protein ACP5VE_08135 [Chthonomonadales bacterium]